ncbi:MAG: Gfo/Idh/MocA family oxidoreductase [Phycisphaerales bacterium]|nr:MAG: Gfo/Idh/MocA family oxidoreductase [Phycisphaerales bacterium]
MNTHKLRMGMVGGGRDAFIGAVHRTAACMDGRVSFVAGALSSTPEKALASGRDVGLDDRRNYGTWREMLERELALPQDQRIDFVSIVTPNDTHFPVAEAFVQAGFAVVCDKPLVHTSQQAAALIRAVQRAETVFAVTYNYSGYPMVKQARHMVEQGELGDIRKVIVEYNQGWLADKIEETGQKQAQWRTDPARSGIGGAIGDIGSHAEQLVAYVTGLEIDGICADITTFVPGRRLDDDANLLVRYTNGARGLLFASQICIGSENDLRLRAWGTKGGIEWRQEEPNHLVFRPEGRPERIYRRGNDYLCQAAKNNTRLPFGHPEAFIEAFANVYNAAGDAIRAGAGADGGPKHDYPDVYDGARGVHFIERTVASSERDQKWTDARWTMRRGSDA